MKHDRVSPDLLRRIIRYEPETGKLFWLPRPIEMFSPSEWQDRQCNSWNSRCSGKEAFARSGRYCTGTLFGANALGHRLAWAIFYGKWPDGEIDHINGNSRDNRIENLRSVSRQINNQNRGIAKNNTSGVIGVNWYSRHNCWRAFIKIGGKSQHLGHFQTFDQAVAVRKAAECRLGFHPNHGRKAL